MSLLRTHERIPPQQYPYIQNEPYNDRDRPSKNNNKLSKRERRYIDTSIADCTGHKGDAARAKDAIVRLALSLGRRRGIYGRCSQDSRVPICSRTYTLCICTYADMLVVQRNTYLLSRHNPRVERERESTTPPRARSIKFKLPRYSRSHCFAPSLGFILSSFFLPSLSIAPSSLQNRAFLSLAAWGVLPEKRGWKCRVKFRFSPRSIFLA